MSEEVSGLQTLPVAPRIVVIGGSPRKAGRTRAVSAHAERVLGELGAAVTRIDLCDADLPLYDGDSGHWRSEPLQAWKRSLDEADGFFIVTPDYHNGMSGALKNALDWVGGDQFRNKPVSIAAVAGGGKGGINALNNLRIVLRGLYALTLADQTVIDKSHINEQLQLADEPLERRIRAMAEELLHLARLVRRKEAEAR